MKHAPLLSLALILAGCAAEARPAAYTERDSAGVRIVEYADTPTATSSVRLTETPVYRVGDEPGEHEFSSVGVGALQPDGGAVVVDGGRSPQVLSIGADGRIRSVLARAGQGPTEVGFAASVLVLGQDTILIQDPTNAKMMIFGGDTLIRSVRTPADRSQILVGAVGFVPPGTVVMMTRGYSPVAQPTWIQGHLMRFDLDAQTVDTVGSYDLADPPARTGPIHPFRPSGAAVWSGASFVSARSDVAELKWRDSDGQVRQLMRWNPRLIHPTTGDVDTLIALQRASMLKYSEGNPPERIEQILRRQTDRYQLDSERPLPFFGRLVADGSGGVWISDYQIGPMSDGFSRWSRIGPDGEWLGSVTLPERFRLLDIRGDKVLGVLRDEMDVESVAVFTLTSEPRRP